jgi:DNA-binding transcriptional MerR regulator
VDVTADATHTIEEAAQATGVSAHTLRYYERIGLLEPVGRASSGHRRYGEGDLASIRFLTLLRQTGMPIRDMARFVELTRAGERTLADRVMALEAHQEVLAAQIALLHRHYEAITNKIKYYRNMLEEALV